MSTADAQDLKLKKVGDAATLRIMSCELMKIGTYPEIQFAGVDATGVVWSVKVPQRSADRQLERLNLTYKTAVGQTLTISRSPNAQVPSKPFWDVVVADMPVTAQPFVSPSPAAPTSVDEPPLTRREQAAPPNIKREPGEKTSTLYARITDHVLTDIVPKYKAQGIPVTMEGTAAIVATVFIQANH